MKRVAIWDTYVKKRNGAVMHFDIIVPLEISDPATIYSYGKEYMELHQELESQISFEECQFCHIEEPSEVIRESIEDKGYYILEMDEIPAHLPEKPSKRDLIKFIKAHNESQRFTDLKQLTIEELQTLLN